MIFSLLSIAHATGLFDATRPQATFDGQECYTVEGDIRLWGRVERLADNDRALFAAEDYNETTAWPAAAAYAPWIADAFGTAEPHSSTFLLHAAPGWEAASGTPILMVHGAGDNASRGFITMATRFALDGRPVFALTFPHPHGDVFRHAETVANAIARVKELTGASQVDLVGHSKGGVEVAVYLSNTDGADWGDTETANAYESIGTPYRGDVRRAVLIATPLAGVDTAFRWPSGNLASLDADTALAPTSWSAYYPYGTANIYVTTDLSDQDFLAADGDLFPGQRQLLARQSAELPGASPWLGAYALQQDWWTSYEGGVGYYTTSDGIDAAIADGGDLLTHLAERGVDPGVELYLLAGQNPLMPNGTNDYLTELFGETFVDMTSATSQQWAQFVADLVGDGLVDVGIGESEVQGLVAGDLVLGEISGPSDGLVFIDSATAGDRLTARGAEVVETRVVNLSHVDMLYASPITGQLMIDAAEADPSEDGWLRDVGERYVEADTLGWVEGVLADEGGGDSGGDTGAPDNTGGDTDADDGTVDLGRGGGSFGGCGGCNGAGGADVALGAVLAASAALAGRRRR